MTSSVLLCRRLLIEYVSVSEDKLTGNIQETKKAGINVNYRIAKSFYVTPKGVKPKIKLQEAKRITKEENEKLLLSLENSGNKHQILHGLTVKITTKDKKTLTVSLDKEDLGGSINILSQSKRELIIPCPDQLKGKDIRSAEIIGIDP